MQKETYMKHNPQHALVITYSQTGQTTLFGRLIAAIWKARGLSTDTADFRDFDVSTLSSYDLIMAGTPVFYWDVPSNVIERLSAAPRLDGTPVASFVTYGGEGGNQHNTAVRLLTLLSGRGGLPVGTETFGGISTFAPTWSMGNERRTLTYRHRPDTETYDRVRRYADLTLSRAREGTTTQYGKEFFLMDFLRGRPSVAFNKLLTGRHTINGDTCTGCGVCEKGCPVGAIDIDANTVDRTRCISCLGCVNNCAAGAIDMTFMGKKVYGFREFKKRHGIRTIPPAELKRKQ
jgi:ferredoxin/menaquinone-dependent protoporphyrinogen IX oxidase